MRAETRISFGVLTGRAYRVTGRIGNSERRQHGTDTVQATPVEARRGAQQLARGQIRIYRCAIGSYVQVPHRHI